MLNISDRAYLNPSLNRVHEGFTWHLVTTSFSSAWSLNQGAPRRWYSFIYRCVGHKEKGNQICAWLSKERGKMKKQRSISIHWMKINKMTSKQFCVIEFIDLENIASNDCFRYFSPVRLQCFHVMLCNVTSHKITSSVDMKVC